MEIDRIQEQLDEEGEQDFVDTLNEDETKQYYFDKWMKGVKREASSHLVGAVSNLASPRVQRKIDKAKKKLQKIRRIKLRKPKRK